MTPTARSLAECRRRGWLAQVVEQTIPRTFIKRDLFGIIDIIAVVPRTETRCANEEAFDVVEDHILGIQVTSGSNHAARIAKAKAEPRLQRWLSAGGRFEVWSWAKRGARGKRKTWTLRIEEVTA